MTLFDYSPITERPRLTWPDGKRVAFYVGLNLEHFRLDQPSTSIWPGPPVKRPTHSTTAGVTTAPGSASGAPSTSSTGMASAPARW